MEHLETKKLFEIEELLNFLLESPLFESDSAIYAYLSAAKFLVWRAVWLSNGNKRFEDEE